MKTILIVGPSLTVSGGVAEFLKSLYRFSKERYGENVGYCGIGGAGFNPFVLLKQTINVFFSALNYKCIFLNPSMGSLSFVRDSLFAILVRFLGKELIVFYHGWNWEFSERVGDKYLWLYRIGLARAKVSFVLCKEFEAELRAWDYKGEIILETTFYNEDLTKHNFGRKAISSKSMRLLYLARIVREKGIFEVIEAAKNLYNRGFLINLKILGDGPDLLDVIRECEGIGWIDVYGRVEGDTKIQALFESDIYCFPTYYGEGLPISVLEALAFGLYVLTTDDGGLGDFFVDGEMGRVVEPKNAKTVENALIELSKNDSLLNSISSKNALFAKKNLTDKVVCNRIISRINKEYFLD